MNLGKYNTRGIDRVKMFFSSLQKTKKTGQRARGNKNTHNRSQAHIGDVKLDKTNENGGFNEDVDGKAIKTLN